MPNARADPPPSDVAIVEDDALTEGSVAPLGLYGLELSLNTASLEVLERVVRETSGPWLEARFAEPMGPREAVRISTCHRVELVLLVDSPDTVDRWLASLPGPADAWTVREGRAAVVHLFRVAAGLESLARGEAEVRRQLAATRENVVSRHARPVLRELLAASVRAAEALDGASGGPASIARAATERLLELLPRTRPRVLVVGSGTVGRQVVDALGGAAEVVVAFHRHPPRPADLERSRARAVPLGSIADELGRCDAVVTAAKFSDRGLRAADLPRGRPLVLVDLGVPRNIDPDVRALPNVRLVDLEELHVRAKGLPRASPADPRVEEAALAYADRLDQQLLEPWVAAVWRAAEELRRAELATAREHLGNLAAEQHDAIDRLTRRLVGRLLRAPTERLRALPAGPEGEMQRRLALALLQPPSDGS